MRPQSVRSGITGIGALLVLNLIAPLAKTEPDLFEPANLTLLPTATNSLLGIDVGRLRGSALYRFFEERAREREPSSAAEIDEWAALTGFDPRRDLEELLIASWQSPDQRLQPGQALPFLLVARGRFDSAKLGEQFIARGAAVEEYRDARVFLFPRDQPGAPAPTPGETIVIPPPVPEGLPQIAIGFVDEGLAVLGGFDAIAEAIDRRLLGASPAPAHPSLLERASALRDGHQIWAVSVQPVGLLNQGPARAGADTKLIEILQSMSESTLALDLSGGIQGRMAAHCGNEGDAKLLGDLARGFLAMARFSNGAGDSLTPMLEHVTVVEDGPSIEVAVDVDGAQLEAYLQKLMAGDATAN